MAGEVITVAELSKLSGTLEVNWELWVSCNKDKGMELALEPMMGQESWKCDSCEWYRVECMRPKVSQL